MITVTTDMNTYSEFYHNMTVTDNITFESTTCKHCNDDLGNQIILYNGNKFCCTGCRTVFEILEANDMCSYYNIDSNPGLSQRKTINDGYEYLNDEKYIDKFSRAISDSQRMVTFKVPQVHCSSCIWLLEKLYKFHNGIISSEVDFLRKEIDIRYDYHNISLSEIAQLMSSVGYQPHIDQENIDDSKYQKSLILKIGIAGFAFGNIMLFSFPEYLGLNNTTFKSWFGFVSFLLILPSLLYSAQDYFTSAYQSIKYKYFNISIPLVLGMLAMFFLSIYDIIVLGGSGYFDSLAGLIFFLLLGKWYQQKNFYFLSFDRSYKSYFPISVIRIQNGIESSINIDAIAEGDKLLIKNNQIIPCDSYLLSEEAFIDYSFVSGESIPVNVKEGQLIYAGGRLTSKGIKITADKIVNNSYLIKLWNNSVFSKSDKRQETLNDKISKQFGITILILSFVAFLLWINVSLEKAIFSFASVLIIACPCAIAITRPFLYGNVIRLLAKAGIYVKNTDTIEKLPEITTILFDKTGTITLPNESDIEYHGSKLSQEEIQFVSNLTNQSIHPLSKYIHNYINDNNELAFTDFEEIGGKGLTGNFNGSIVKIGSGKWLGVDQQVDVNETRVYLQFDNILKGYYSFKNKYRHELANIVNTLHRNLINTEILSGDNDSEKTRLKEIFGIDTQMYFNNSPQDKLDHVSNLQKEGKLVAMVGDGLNDAGALKQSNIGIVIAEEGSHFTPSSDIIIHGNKFSSLTSIFKISRYAQNITYGAYTIAVLYNIIGLSYALQGLLSPILAAILMPLSSLSILLFTLLTSGYFVKKILKSDQTA